MLTASACRGPVAVLDAPQVVRSSWAGPNGDVWFVGGKGMILRERDGVVEPVPSPTNLDLVDVWGCDDDHVWAAGGYSQKSSNEAEKGVLLTWGGAVWKVVPTPLDGLANLDFIAGASCDDLWIGGQGHLLRGDGSNWDAVALPRYHSFYDVTVVPGGVYGSDSGYVHRWTGSGWEILEPRAVADPTHQSTFGGTIRGLGNVGGTLVAWWDRTLDGVHGVGIWGQGGWQHSLCRGDGLEEIADVSGVSADDLWVAMVNFGLSGTVHRVREGKCERVFGQKKPIHSISIVGKTVWFGGSDVWRKDLR